jgi:hypothetical protein
MEEEFECYPMRLERGKPSHAKKKSHCQRPFSRTLFLFSSFYSSLCESGMRPLLFRTPRRQKFSVPIRAVAVFVGVLPGASSSLLISGEPGLLPLTPTSLLLFSIFQLATFNFPTSSSSSLFSISNCGVEGGNPSLKVPWPRTSYTCILRRGCVPLFRRQTMSQCVYMCLTHLSNHRSRVFRASLSLFRGYWGREQATCICTM